MEGSTPSLREQAIQALREGEIDTAIDLLSRAVSADSRDAEALALLGLAYSRKDLQAQARQVLETAVDLEPRNARYLCHLGTVLEQSGDLPGALGAYRETLRIDPSHPEAQARAAALEARAALSPAGGAEFELPPPGAARADAPWLVGQYAAAAGSGYSSAGAEAPGVSSGYSEPRIDPAPSRPGRDEGRRLARRRLADPAGRDGNGRLVRYLAVYTAVTIGLLGWLVSRWVPGIVREATLPRPSPAVQSLLYRAWQAEQRAHPDEAEHLFQQALEEARALADQPGEAMSLLGLGDLSYRHKQPRRALQYLQPALSLFRQLGDHRSEANTLNNMGLAYSDIRQPKRALENLRQALAAVRQAGDKSLEAAIIDSFGMVYEAAGQPQRALPYYEKTLAMARQIGDKQLESLEIKNTARMQRQLPPGWQRAVGDGG